jgi:hypothetical protein
MVRAFTMSDCEVDAMKGGRFNMFGGNVSGEFTELVREYIIIIIKFILI